MKGLSWLGIVRLGLVQAAIGALTVLMTTTLNRIMVVEYHLAVTVPAALVAWHYAVQLTRARWGHGSDGGQRTPWIVGGMALLAAGALLATLATTWSRTSPAAAVGLAVVAFTLVGVGVGAAGTSLLALLAGAVAPARRPAAAAIAWVMLIVGFVVTTAVVGRLLDPFTPTRLLTIVAGVGATAIAVTAGALIGVERGVAAESAPRVPFLTALRGIADDPAARHFTLFIAVSMVAYSTQELIVEPMAGLLFGMSPGESTRLASLQHGGALIGMVAVGLGGTLFARSRGWLRATTVAGCVGAAAALALLAAAAAGTGVPLRPAVAALGFACGVFTVGAVGSMMALAGGGGPGREGVRMGVWGAAQAIAFAVGGFAGAAGVDLGRRVAAPETAFAIVFGIEALLFLVAAALALRAVQPVVTLQPARG
ncbi:MAG: PucC family protein [Sphingomonadaceae bacterium]|nr:PucC family protein [Sphingomonadaceae bacterium]